MWQAIKRRWQARQGRRPTAPARDTDRLTAEERAAIVADTRAQQQIADELAVEMAVIRGERARERQR